MPLMSQVVVEKETATQQAVDVPWNVVVHNDPVNLMSYVTMVFPWHWRSSSGARTAITG